MPVSSSSDESEFRNRIRTVLLDMSVAFSDNQKVNSFFSDFKRKVKLFPIGQGEFESLLFDVFLYFYKNERASALRMVVSHLQLPLEKWIDSLSHHYLAQGGNALSLFPAGFLQNRNNQIEFSKYAGFIIRTFFLSGIRLNGFEAHVRAADDEVFGYEMQETYLPYLTSAFKDNKLDKIEKIKDLSQENQEFLCKHPFMDCESWAHFVVRENISGAISYLFSLEGLREGGFLEELVSDFFLEENYSFLKGSALKAGLNMDKILEKAIKKAIEKAVLLKESFDQELCNSAYYESHLVAIKTSLSRLLNIGHVDLNSFRKTVQEAIQSKIKDEDAQALSWIQRQVKATHEIKADFCEKLRWLVDILYKDCFFISSEGGVPAAASCNWSESRKRVYETALAEARTPSYRHYLPCLFHFLKSRTNQELMLEKIVKDSSLAKPLL